MNGLMLRRQVMMAGKAAPVAPLYVFNSGTRQNGNMVVSSNHFYYKKRYGGNPTNTFGQLSGWDTPPFRFAVGDKVRTVLTFNTSITTGQGVRIVAGTNTGTVAELLAYNTVLVSEDNPIDNAHVEDTVTISKDYQEGDFQILVNPLVKTAGQIWEGDIEIYVNGTRYI